MGKKVAQGARDLFLALALGVGTGLVLGLVLWGIGALVGGIANGFVVARSGLMLVGGFLMIFAAILLLKGGNLPKEAFQLRPWKHREKEQPETAQLPKLFWIVGRRYTALFLAIGILLVSAIPDYVVHIST